MKQLTLSLRKSGGRNNKGRICSFHIGGGHKKRYRLIDFTRQANIAPAIVRTIEKDPSRTAYISLMSSQLGSLFYILTPEGIRKGDVLISNNKYALMTGSSMKIKYIPLGNPVHNVALNFSNSLVRAAGCYAQILKKTHQQALIKLPSGNRIKVDLENTATMGKLSNAKHFYRVQHKAGRTRWAGKTPVVRGVAMNPVDHPMGGKTHGKLHRTPWGKVAKGLITRKA